MKPMAAEMEWVRGGATDGSDDFVRRFREPVFRLALSITGRADLAEDIAQDTLLRALKHRRTLDDPLPWLRVVTVRRAMSALKAAQAPIRLDEGSQTDVDSSLAVKQTLAALPAEQQALLALAIGEGWSYAEIADVLQIPEGTVASRLHTAKEAFRRKWGK